MERPMLIARLGSLFFATRVRVAITCLIAAAAIAGLAALVVVAHLTHGGMVARQEPSSAEAFIAGRILDLSIPADAQRMTSPVDAKATGAIDAGRALFQRSCAVCHASDGRGNTAAGGGLYPKPTDLQSSRTAQRSDGALFYLIRNGIRNTGMPGWKLSDDETWQLVAYLRQLPITVPPSGAPAAASAALASAHYVGSAACSACHQTIYDHWKKTLMANVVRDPKEHPEAIIPDLSVHDPLVTFTKDDIAFVYGSKWKQRYFTRSGDDYVPLPAQWDVTHKKWKAYFVKDDWWVQFYPPDNAKRPTGTTCDGCHSVDYDIVTKRVAEWNVGCEKCHGPGSEHVHDPVAATIIDPKRLDAVQANDVCIQCHSQGRPPGNPIAGKYYDWPVGYHVGLKLADFWAFEEHKLGETTFTHFADGTAHKNRMQGNDYVTSQMYAHGVTCFTCHDSHGTDQPSLLRKPASTLCLDCHGPGSPNGPRAPTLEQHTHHRAGSPGNECIACHMPKIAQTIGDVNVRSHTFRFVGPALTESAKVPNACNACHADKTTGWTIETLRSWSDQSPWRVAR